jgi:hypothetical protein
MSYTILHFLRGLNDNARVTPIRGATIRADVSLDTPLFADMATHGTCGDELKDREVKPRNNRIEGEDYAPAAQDVVEAAGTTAISSTARTRIGLKQLGKVSEGTCSAAAAPATCSATRAATIRKTCGPSPFWAASL